MPSSLSLSLSLANEPLWTNYYSCCLANTRPTSLVLPQSRVVFISTHTRIRHCAILPCQLGMFSRVREGVRIAPSPHHHHQVWAHIKSTIAIHFAHDCSAAFSVVGGARKEEGERYKMARVMTRSLLIVVFPFLTE